MMCIRTAVIGCLEDGESGLELNMYTLDYSVIKQKSESRSFIMFILWITNLVRWFPIQNG